MLRLFLCLLGAVSLFAPARADTGSGPVIAVAASLRPAIEDIARTFTARSDHAVRPTYGSTSGLVRQIEEGAPFELLLAADEESVRRLAGAGLTEGDGAVLVRGRLVLAAPVDSPVTVDERLEGLTSAVAAGRVRRFAIANPELAPYGRAAREVLEKAGLWAGLEGRLLLAENIGQAGQFVAFGGAEAGLVARSVTLVPDVGARVRVANVPEDWYSPINQAYVLLKGAGPVAREFHEFLRGPEARATFERLGFVVP